MDVNTRVLRAYINHVLPRDIVRPVIIVFSLEGVTGYSTCTFRIEEEEAAGD